MIWEENTHLSELAVMEEELAMWWDSDEPLLWILQLSSSHWHTVSCYTGRIVLFLN